MQVKPSNTISFGGFFFNDACLILQATIQICFHPTSSKYNGQFRL